MDSLWRVLTPSVFPDDEQTRVARLLHWLLLTAIGLDLLDAVLLFFFAPETLPTIWLNGLMLAFLVAAFWLTRRGIVRAASLLICLSLWALLTYYLVISGGVTSPAFEFYNLVIIIAAVLLSARGAAAFGLLCILTTIILYIGGMNGWLQSVEATPTPGRLFATHTVIFVSLAVLMGLSGRNVQQSLTRAKRDERTLIFRNEELRQEINERENAQQALKLSEERFFKAFQANPTAITISTLEEGRFIDANDACQRLLGYSREEMIGHTSIGLPTWANSDDRARAMEELLEKGSVHQMESQFRRKNGQLCDTLVSLEVIELGGEPHLLGMLEDITERKQTERRLRESQEEFRQLSDATFEGVVLSEQGRIILANKQAAEMLGYEYSEMIGMEVFKLVAPESRELVTERIRSGYDKAYDHLALRKDGTIFPVEVRGRLMPYNGRMVRVTAVRDLTERKQAEQQRLELALQTERLESFKEFLSKISHDLKTPLTIINTSLYLLERLDDPERQRGKIETIRQQAMLVEKFIQDLLTLSRLEHAPNFSLTPMDVNTLLGQIQANLNSAAEQHNVNLQFKLDQTIPNVLGDEAELYRALGNLVENAVNYTLSEGSVTVQSFRRDRLVVTEISDTGIGISGQELPHIFERFFRSEGARRVAGNGTGLGLAIVKRIVDIHNGTIEVESTPGIGTTFRVCLPSIIVGADTSAPVKLA